MEIYSKLVKICQTWPKICSNRVNIVDGRSHKNITVVVQYSTVMVVDDKYMVKYFSFFFWSSTTVDSLLRYSWGKKKVSINPDYRYIQCNIQLFASDWGIEKVIVCAILFKMNECCRLRI